MFNCKQCSVDKRLKKVNGCEKEPSRKLLKKYGFLYVWTTDFCFLCGGLNEKCPECKGSNAQPVFRCPRALAKEVQSLLPYYYDWRKSNHIIWPDGRSRMYQPIKLTRAFDFMDAIVSGYIDEEQKNGSKH